MICSCSLLVPRIHPQSPRRLLSSALRPPIPPPSPTSNHHDLPSFLDYAARTSLNPKSTTYVGTHYEYTTRESLRRFALDLTRIGGRLDSGIDLVGTWHLPDSGLHPLRVIVQCKALKNKLGPNVIRELEGAFLGAPVGWRGQGILGMLVSSRESTKGLRNALSKSTYPLVWIFAELDGHVRQVLWNECAEDVGLSGLGVEVKHVVEAQEHGGFDKTVCLTWNGEEIKGLGGKTE
ncbi:hypothetical protein PABG_05315 [Paracoccidioides brasiliensis Pb03]|uniref:Restriction endonuclease type IV Mrr domain-containing protein n=1 Tax=Paracoccidioides brasiliensis (strain Pb18) TaxID=502780 RepID=A0A0A0HR09_PARBD|nr:uncharacterized protein PADG_12209 [Paracoccidioides brasiliensis Pb18]EEH23104.1 hypothetical protein PABG_05315 [Paracoccidioides brasiliensis Pb03]KGM91639.1 hypothetical protein PADG_12209 [Paracoccidioides brasiliensis Pb18]ODH45920.1 hypothetical protein GX48_07992 [Paracoccidioides brasiliensis]